MSLLKYGMSLTKKKKNIKTDIGYIYNVCRLKYKYFLKHRKRDFTQYLNNIWIMIGGFHLKTS